MQLNRFWQYRVPNLNKRHIGKKSTKNKLKTFGTKYLNMAALF